MKIALIIIFIRTTKFKFFSLKMMVFYYLHLLLRINTLDDSSSFETILYHQTLGAVL